MALDNAQFISELSITDPPGTDPLSEGDDQIRTSKRAVFQSFPFVDKQVDLTADQLNAAGIKNQFNNWVANNTFNATTTFGAQTFAFNGTTGAPSYSFVSEGGMGMYFAGGGLLGFATGGVTRFTASASALNVTPPITVLDGSAAGPPYTFASQPAMGMYRIANGILGFSPDGTEQFRLTNVFAQFAGQLRASTGSAAAPHYSFTNSVGLGISWLATNIMGFSAGGVEKGRLTETLWQWTVAGQFQNENTVTRVVDTQPRTGWRYTNNANQPMWAIYLGTEPANTLAFQRYDAAGAFQDIPFSIRQSNGLLRMSTLPTSVAGLISGELWNNNNFVAVAP